MSDRLLAFVASAVPVTPGADEARSWLEDELLDPVYHRSRSLLQRFLDWLQQQFEGAPRFGAPSLVVAAVVVGVLLVVAVLAFWVAGPVRRSRRVRAAGALRAGDDRRTAAELRAAADEAANQGRWGLAVAERFRAIVRDLEQRTVLDDRPGRTADEAVDAAAARLPELDADLRRAARRFDDVVYGDGPADATDDTWLRGLDDSVARARVSAGISTPSEAGTHGGGPT
ncbi:hypothetical protein DDP54_02635 [Cellulomonas sp. WB94]|uniref:DUF4129 domain-containing protein n=1 Tax=Cellulomonas sp. WB94 TaxID=2173174 RepID=UPI000D57F74C|nr:DUF4129 domain-containing protein [Cellulomonas sp. WB94]PVU82086.1 hypothetical protein DDP54_02635 [Cellulomonas sp. WB94]